MELSSEAGPLGGIRVKLGKASWTQSSQIGLTALTQGEITATSYDTGTGGYSAGHAGESQLTGASINSDGWSLTGHLWLHSWDDVVIQKEANYWIKKPTVNSVTWQDGSTTAVDIEVTLNSITDTLKCSTTSIATLYAVPYREGYNYAGTKVNLSGTTITVPTSYWTAASSAGWGTKDYTLAAEGYNGGVKAIVKDGSTTKISTNCALTLVVPTNIDSEGKATVEVTSGSGDSKVTVKSGSAKTLYNNGYKAGWNAAAAAAGKSKSGTSATCTLPDTSDGTSYTTTTYKVTAGTNTTTADSHKLDYDASSYIRQGASFTDNGGYDHTYTGTAYWYKNASITGSGPTVEATLSSWAKQ